MSNDKTVVKPKVFFSEVGSLHDALITAFSWNKRKQELSVDIDDLNSGFLDLPEYNGLRPVEIVFKGVRNFSFDMEIESSGLSIYDFSVEEGPCYSVNIKCSPGGYIKCQCEAIELIDS